MMLRQAAFAGGGALLKGNLHTHTTRSDGRGSPAGVIRQYASMGYDFLALTDHRLYNYENYAPETQLLILPATELDANMPSCGVHCVHIVSVGPEKGNGFMQDQRWESLRISRAGEAQPLIDEILAAGNLPIFCHPEWSGNTAGEMLALTGYPLMEIWNSGCVIEDGLDQNAAYWDELLHQGRRIYGVASDDGHSVEQHGHGFIRVRAERNASSILAALKQGAFYASCGPEIYDFYVEDGVATVVSSPVSTIRFRHFHVPYREIHGSGITAGQMQLRPGSGYVRAEAVDEKGRRAWTNPIFLDWEEK